MLNQAAKNKDDQPHSIRVEELGPDVSCHELNRGQPPLFIEPRGKALVSSDAFFAWAAAKRAVFDDLIVRHGGIFLRGFPTLETEDFEKLTNLFPNFEAGYVGGYAPRAAVRGRVMESTRLKASRKLALHSEMAYMRDYPKRIAFFCRQAATQGGETIIGDLRSLVEHLPPNLADKIEKLGARMTRSYAPKSDGLEKSVGDMESIGWNIAFGTDDKAKVETLCAERGLEPLWNEDGSLTLFNRLQPFVVHPQTGKRLYRSLLHVPFAGVAQRGAHRSGMSLGNGESLSSAETEKFQSFIDSATYAWPWRNGDIMILDNLQVWHGRNPYQGSREVQVALLA